MVSQEVNLTADDAEPQNQEAETALLFYQGLRGIYEMHYGGELRLVENTLSLHVCCLTLILVMVSSLLFVSLVRAC